MDQVLPTPPRSPAPSPLKIKLEQEEIEENFLNHDFSDFSEDLFSLISPKEESSSRKRKFSELLSVGEMDQFLRDLQQSPSPTSSHTFSLSTDLLCPTSPTSNNSLLDNLLLNLETTTPPPTRPQSPQSQIKQEFEAEEEEETLSDFLNTFTTSLDSYNFDDTTFPISPPLKRQKFDSFSSNEDLLNDDCFLFTDVKQEVNNHSLEHLRSALLNDHNYCSMEEEEVLIDGVEVGGGGEKFCDVLNFDNIPKKTKILVPLKSLMKTLQQKSFLVSPLGPGKKVIRLTGAGESVKGVLQSTSALLSSSSQSSSSSSSTSSSNYKPNLPQHNVRKRPHTSLLTTKLSKLEEIDPISSTPTTPKKKTKAHNNMERMRRIDLRNSFDNLKKLVPVLSKSPKCSKVEILRRAEEYVRGLRSVEKKLIKEEGLLRVRMQELKGRLTLG